MKDFLAFILIVTRRWSKHSESSKTSRVIYATSMILMLYTCSMLFLLLTIVINTPVYDWVSLNYGGEVFIGFLLALWFVVNIVLFIYMKITYSESVIQSYIDRYSPNSERMARKQRVQALLFVGGGLLSIFIPIMLDKLLKLL